MIEKAKAIMSILGILWAVIYFTTGAMGIYISPTLFYIVTVSWLVIAVIIQCKGS